MGEDEIPLKDYADAVCHVPKEALEGLAARRFVKATNSGGLGVRMATVSSVEPRTNSTANGSRVHRGNVSACTTHM